MAVWPVDHRPKFDPASTGTNGVLVLGDSHCRSYAKHHSLPKFIDKKNVERQLYFHRIRGASMSGFGRRKSSLNLNSAVHKLIVNYQSHVEFNVFAFGQVDVELGLYYRWLTKPELVDPFDLFEEITTRYIENIMSFNARATPIIKGINQTMLADQPASIRYVSRVIHQNETDAEIVKNQSDKLISIYPEYSVRKMLSIEFNKMLAQNAAKSGMRYFDLNSIIADPVSGDILDIYQPATWDHHLVDSIETRKISRDCLAKVIG